MSPAPIGACVLHSWPHSGWPLICVRLESPKEQSRSRVRRNHRLLDGPMKPEGGIKVCRRIPGWYAAGSLQEGLAQAPRGRFPGHLTTGPPEVRGGPVYLGGPRNAPQEGGLVWRHLMAGLPLPLLPALGHTALGRVAKWGPGYPPSDPPWAGTQTLTCGGWQAGGRSGPGVPQG